VLPLPQIIWHEWTTRKKPVRRPEPSEAMDDVEQVRAYVEAYAWGGPTSAVQLHHLYDLARLIRPGDVVVDLACGPGPLLLELAPLYPDTRFIGVDLSPTMLTHLEREVAIRGLRNVEVRCEDIRTLPSLADGTVDLVISTSALHHLPEDAGLIDVFRRCRSLIRPGGGFYFFDFGLLKSEVTRRLFVREVARQVPAITARDYEQSLDAAFRVDWVWEAAQRELPRPFIMTRSAFVDIVYFLRTPSRTEPSAEVLAYAATIWERLPAAMKAEYALLRRLRSSREAK
jgi:arsenite methyltransferase